MQAMRRLHDGGERGALQSLAAGRTITVGRQQFQGMRALRVAGLMSGGGRW